MQPGKFLIKTFPVDTVEILQIVFINSRDDEAVFLPNKPQRNRN